MRTSHPFAPSHLAAVHQTSTDTLSLNPSSGRRSLPREGSCVLEMRGFFFCLYQVNLQTQPETLLGLGRLLPPPLQSYRWD